MSSARGGPGPQENGRPRGDRRLKWVFLITLTVAVAIVLIVVSLTVPRIQPSTATGGLLQEELVTNVNQSTMVPIALDNATVGESSSGEIPVTIVVVFDLNCNEHTPGSFVECSIQLNWSSPNGSVIVTSIRATAVGIWGSSHDILEVTIGSLSQVVPLGQYSLILRAAWIPSPTPGPPITFNATISVYENAPTQFL